MSDLFRIQDGVLVVAEWVGIRTPVAPDTPVNVRLVRPLTYAANNRHFGWQQGEWVDDVGIYFLTADLTGQLPRTTVARFTIPFQGAHGQVPRSTQLDICGTYHAAMHGPLLWLYKRQLDVPKIEIRSPSGMSAIPGTLSRLDFNQLRETSFRDIAKQVGWSEDELDIPDAIWNSINTWWAKLQTVTGHYPICQLGVTTALNRSISPMVSLGFIENVPGEASFLELSAKIYGQRPDHWPGIVHIPVNATKLFDKLVELNLIVPEDALEQWYNEFIPEPDYVAFDALNELRELLNEQPVWMDSNAEVFEVMEALTRD